MNEPEPLLPVSNSTQKLLLLWAVFASGAAFAFALVVLILVLRPQEAQEPKVSQPQEARIRVPPGQPMPPELAEGSTPLSPEEYMERGFNLLRKRQPERASAIFEACIRAYPDFSDGYHGLAQAQREGGDPLKALPSHDRAIALNPERFDLYWERGLTFQRLNNPDAAIANFEACLERNSTFANAHLGLASAYRAKGDFDNALLHNNKAIDLNPRSAWFYRERGLTYEAIRDKEHAEADFEKSRDLEQNQSPPGRTP